MFLHCVWVVTYEKIPDIAEDICKVKEKINMDLILKFLFSFSL